MKINVLLLGAFMLLIGAKVHAQDDIMDILNEESNDVPQYVFATFKGTRLINGHSVETRKQGTMDFIVSHRFGRLNSGAYELFGLDQANMRLGFDFGVTDAFNAGIGRNSFEKTYDGYLKYKLFRQSLSGGSPVTVTAFTSMAIKTLKDAQYEDQITFEDRLTYTYQLLIARKFGSGFSFQLMPSMVHFNAITEEQSTNDIFSLGAGGRVKLNQRFSINAEYYYQFNKLTEDNTNTLAIGVDIETGGHVFQLQFTSARSMIEKGFIAENQNDFFDGDIHFGFNVSRAFQLVK